MPKISVIVPVYNVEKYLKECLNSLINQTYQDYEIILINDGSKDNSDEICCNYQQKYKNVIYICQGNQGVSVARNKGLEIAKGEIVCFVDSDDTVDKNFLKEIDKAFSNQNCDVLWIENKNCRRDTSMIGCLPTWGYALKNEFLKKYPDIIYPPNIQPGEDGIFSHEILAMASKVGHCKRAKYYYRKRMGSSEMSLETGKLVCTIQKWLDILHNFYEKYNLYHTHKLHILTFLCIEPFGRFKHVNFLEQEKLYLYDVLHNFICEHNLNEAEDKKLLPVDFQIFINSAGYDDYVCKNSKNKDGLYLTPLQKIFSVKNSLDRKHKIITIFGIKLKIKK